MKFSIGKRFRQIRFVDIFVFIVFFLSNLTAFSFLFNFWIFITAYQLGTPQIAVIGIISFFWIISAIIVYFVLRKHNELIKYLRLWKKQWPLLVFISIAIFSIFWSINPMVSAYKVILLIVSTGIGIFLGLRYQKQQLLDLLFWFFSILMLISLALAVLQPGIGTMEGHPYFGAWCGPFWNRNHLGSLAALSIVVFLIHAFSGSTRKNHFFFIDLLLAALSMFIVYQTKSATGYILTLVLAGATIVMILWLRFRQQLRTGHYVAIFIVLVLAAIAILNRLDFFLGLINRNSSLTGRIPMWNFLINTIIGSNPWVGYGFGGIWSMGIFRYGMHLAVHWPYPLLIADNGYLDILLSVGIIGFIPFIIVFIQAWIVTIRNTLSGKTLTDFFPLLFVIYVFVANLTFSMFLETETFIWIILIFILTNPPANSEIKSRGVEYP